MFHTGAGWYNLAAYEEVLGIMECQANIVKVARQLTGQLEGIELPEDYDNGELSYPQIIADVRHNYTNYDDVLRMLPLCVDVWASNGICNWDMETDDECCLFTQAHDLIQRKANEIAKDLFKSKT